MRRLTLKEKIAGQTIERKTAKTKIKIKLKISFHNFMFNFFKPMFIVFD
jgi:hypothetical protein